MPTDELLNITVDIDPPFHEIEAKLRGLTVIAVNRAHKETLSQVTDMMTYSASGNPSRPPGSSYRRTFSLLSSYKSEVTSRKLPVIISVWRALSRIASYVIGEPSQQANIHRNRWRNLEQLRREAEMITRDNIDKRLENEI